MVKIRKIKPVVEVEMPVEDSLSDQMVDLAQALIDDITARDDHPGSTIEKQGSNCPRCRSTRVIVETSRAWDDGMKVRYMRCRACRMLFKNILMTTNGRHD